MYKFSETISHFLKEKANEIENKFFVDILSLSAIDVETIDSLLKKHNIHKVEDIKIESIELLLDYANFILRDNVISEDEFVDFEILKKIFKIKEGDFLTLRKNEVNEILQKEFIRIYSDDYVDEREHLLNLNLQFLFDLSYDEFESFKKDEVIFSLMNGANPKDLDIAKIPRNFKL